jgi:hypothetical protein
VDRPTFLDKAEAILYSVHKAEHETHEALYLKVLPTQHCAAFQKGMKRRRKRDK